MSDEFLTVSELNRFIRDVLSSGFPRSLWVCGEIQGYDRGKDKKHVFFELCEKDPVTHDITARIGLVIFAQSRPKIEAILKKAENAFQLKDDIEVKFLCKVDFYPGHGQVRLIVEAIDPVHTLGKIAQDRQRLIALLKQKGILDKNKQLELPELILNVGLVTSYDSAAYHDFISELKKSGYAFRIFLADSVMQGKNTESSVIKALKIFAGMPKDVDAVVITRGGGSIAELSCFDNEKIATAIAQTGIPVLSGIGHEINTTVTDLAAHTFAKTPTAVAKFLVDRMDTFAQGVEDRRGRFFEALRQVFKTRRLRLKDSAVVLQTQTLGLVRRHHQHLFGLASAIQRTPSARMKEAKNRLKDTGTRLKKIIYLHLQNSRTKINHYQKLAQMAEPKNILKRGFSITRAQDGRLIRSVEDAHQVKSIATELIDGIINSEVKSG
ncbi:MAG: exodeoxyribonuclease VII large subunit [Candidatus Omnitrophica bacterium]|nr:exodeoxyribonuclease VII large subunit [Candidatus Omnitrophota bacterium]MDE2008789.1 exodeoxyribonuclease VII large subunit [Candidatus Omnitrophota bacterium]MDE2213648.1 exodeoxyribonuclease VII large subunit [Candidatus Omnitrophota bacterium]MDE2230451.1 exodeoxyribonuclease VII large subunit [Candidatus Omnitrophota bacterium]